MASGILQQISLSRIPLIRTSLSVFTQTIPTLRTRQDFNYFTFYHTQKEQEARACLSMAWQLPAYSLSNTPTITKLWLKSDIRGMPAETKTSVFNHPTWCPSSQFIRTRQSYIKFAGTTTTELLRQTGLWNNRTSGMQLLGLTTVFWTTAQDWSRHNWSLAQHSVSYQVKSRFYHLFANLRPSFRQLENASWPYRVHWEEKDVWGLWYVWRKIKTGDPKYEN